MNYDNPSHKEILAARKVLREWCDYTQCVVEVVAASILVQKIAEAIHSSAPAQCAPSPVDITGWKLVPDDPTEAMWQAGRSADEHPGDSYSKVWRAMFNAAPSVDDCETTSSLSLHERQP